MSELTKIITTTDPELRDRSLDAFCRAASLDQLLSENNNPPQVIFFMIVRQFRLLLKAESLLKKDLTDQAVSKELKVPFFVAKKLREQCRNFSSSKLSSIYELLAEADMALKTSVKEPKLLLESLLVKITSR